MRLITKPVSCYLQQNGIIANQCSVLIHSVDDYWWFLMRIGRLWKSKRLLIEDDVWCCWHVTSWHSKCSSKHGQIIFVQRKLPRYRHFCTIGNNLCLIFKPDSHEAEHHSDSFIRSYWLALLFRNTTLCPKSKTSFAASNEPSSAV